MQHAKNKLNSAHFDNLYSKSKQNPSLCMDKYKSVACIMYTILCVNEYKSVV